MHHAYGRIIFLLSHPLYSELSKLNKRWEKFHARGKPTRFLMRDKDEAAVRGFAENVGRALQIFQVGDLSASVDTCRSFTILRPQELCMLI